MENFGPNIWLADGPVVTGYVGFHYPTRMVVIRLADASLFIWSPIEPDDELMKQINDIGTVRHIVSPNSLHHIYLMQWAALFPEATVYATSDLAKTRPDITGYEVLDDTSNRYWGGGIDIVLLTGNRITQEAVFFHPESKTVIFTDFLQQLPRGWYKGWRNLVARLDLMTENMPAVPRKFRLASRDRKAMREQVGRILGWPVEKVVMAHGRPVKSDGHAALQAAFKWLGPRTGE